MNHPGLKPGFSGRFNKKYLYSLMIAGRNLHPLADYGNHRIQE
jgi:hypothetical protein